MTDWRPPPIRQDDRDNDEIEPKTQSQLISTAAISEPAAEAKTQPRGFAGKIKDLFRDAMKALTAKSPAPEPKPRRKRTTGETGSTFLGLARKLTRHFVRRPVIQTLGLYEPELWQWNDPDAMYFISEEFQPADTNYLSPHL